MNARIMIPLVVALATHLLTASSVQAGCICNYTCLHDPFFGSLCVNNTGECSSVGLVLCDGNSSSFCIAPCDISETGLVCEGTCSDGSHFTTVSVDGLQCANQAAAECAPGTVVAVEGFVAAGIAACCFPNGACGDISGLDCVKFGGTFQGVDSECASASCSACPSDLDGNGEVRVPDLIKLLADWGQCPDPILVVCTEFTNDCCEPTLDVTPGCNNSACCECICACDPFCCDLNPIPGAFWDFNCAGCGIDGSCGASNPNSGCADVCAACVDPAMCP